MSSNVFMTRFQIYSLRSVSIVALESSLFKNALVLVIPSAAFVAYIFWPVISRKIGIRLTMKSNTSGALRQYKGLANTGNSCYLNAAIQALSGSQHFLLWLRKIQSDKLPVRTPLCDVLADLLCQLQIPTDSEDNCLSCDSLLYTLVERQQWNPSNQQQDVHEALVLINEAVIGELLPLSDVSDLFGATKAVKSFDEGRESSLKSLLNKKGFQRGRHLHFLLNFPFTLLALSHQTCLLCGQDRKPVKMEMLHHISIYPAFIQFISPLQKLSLNDLLRKHFDGELLLDVNCDNCTKKHHSPTHVKTSQKRSISLLRAPKCLVIHLNRTFWTSFGEPAKLSNFVDFPLFINLFNFMNRQLQSESSKNLFWYKLSSVVVHLGYSHDYGHYSAFKRIEIDGTDKWLSISDDVVEFCSAQKVFNSCFYILIYDRCYRFPEEKSKL